MDLKRPLSWSALSSFEWDKEQWYQKYCVHGKCLRAKDGQPAACFIFEKVFAYKCPQVETSFEMEFGKMVGERLAADPTFLPHVPRLSIFEYELHCKFGKIPLIGYIDSYEPSKQIPKFEEEGFVDTFPHLFEYKTGKKAWDQKRADEHGQINFYLLCLYLMHKIKPSDVLCSVYWMPTQQNGDFSISLIDEKDVKPFPTKRTMRQILEFGQRINRTWKEMQEYAENHL